MKSTWHYDSYGPFELSYLKDLIKSGALSSFEFHRAWASLWRANNAVDAGESQTLNSFLGAHSESYFLKISANRITLATGNWFWAPLEAVSPAFPTLHTSGSDCTILLPKGNAHLTCSERRSRAAGRGGEVGCLSGSQPQRGARGTNDSLIPSPPPGSWGGG